MIIDNLPRPTRLEDTDARALASLKNGTHTFVLSPFGKVLPILLHLWGRRPRREAHFDLIGSGLEIRPEAYARYCNTAATRRGHTVLHVPDDRDESLMRAARFVCDPKNLRVPPDLEELARYLRD